MAMNSEFETDSDIAYCTVRTKSHLAYDRDLAVTLAASKPLKRLFLSSQKPKNALDCKQQCEY